MTEPTVPTSTPEPTPEVSLVLPFADLSKDEMLEHMATFHNYRYWNGKASKADLERVHDALHEDPKRVDPLRGHEHRGLTTEELADASDAVKALAKPLTVSERAALKQLVDNDFDSLIKEIEAQAAQAEQTAREAVTAAFQAKHALRTQVETEVADAFAEAENAIRLAQDARNTRLVLLKEQAEAQGIRISNTVNASSTRVEVQGEQEAQSKVITKVRRERDTAKLAAQRQRLAVHRQIMLAGIPESMRTLVNEIPKAKDLLLASASDVKAIEPGAQA